MREVAPFYKKLAGQLAAKEVSEIDPIYLELAERMDARARSICREYWQSWLILSRPGLCVSYLPHRKK